MPVRVAVTVGDASMVEVRVAVAVGAPAGVLVTVEVRVDVGVVVTVAPAGVEVRVAVAVTTVFGDVAVAVRVAVGVFSTVDISSAPAERISARLPDQTGSSADTEGNTNNAIASSGATTRAISPEWRRACSFT